MSFTLTKEQAIQEHRKMWNWIAEQNEKGIHYPHSDELKRQYIKEHTDYEYISCWCFCCEYDEKYNLTFRMCGRCPLDWKSSANGIQCCNDSNHSQKGYYSLWNRSKTPEEAAKYARIIANLSERSI